MNTINAIFESTNCDNIGILGKGVLPIRKDEQETINHCIDYFNKLPGSDQNFREVESWIYGEVTHENPLGTIRKTEIHGTIHNEGGGFDYWITVTAAA